MRAGDRCGRTIGVACNVPIKVGRGALLAERDAPPPDDRNGLLVAMGLRLPITGLALLRKLARTCRMASDTAFGRTEA